jgi:hypothetical protein
MDAERGAIQFTCFALEWDQESNIISWYVYVNPFWFEAREHFIQVFA